MRSPGVQHIHIRLSFAGKSTVASIEDLLFQAASLSLLVHSHATCMHEARDGILSYTLSRCMSHSELFESRVMFHVGGREECLQDGWPVARPILECTICTHQHLSSLINNTLSCSLSFTSSSLSRSSPCMLRMSRAVRTSTSLWQGYPTFCHICLYITDIYLP